MSSSWDLRKAIFSLIVLNIQVQSHQQTGHCSIVKPWEALQQQQIWVCVASPLSRFYLPLWRNRYTTCSFNMSRLWNMPQCINKLLKCSHTQRRQMPRINGDNCPRLILENLFMILNRCSCQSLHEPTPWWSEPLVTLPCGCYCELQWMPSRFSIKKCVSRVVVPVVMAGTNMFKVADLNLWYKLMFCVSLVNWISPFDKISLYIYIWMANNFLLLVEVQAEIQLCLIPLFTFLLRRVPEIWVFALIST